MICNCAVLKAIESPATLPLLLFFSGGANTYALCFKTAVKCITYLSEGSRPREDRAFTALGGNMGRVNRWLECIDRGEVSVYSILLLLFFSKGGA